MKKLYIIRHGKSDWDDPKKSDFERPLNSRGEKNAPFMGELLAKQGVIPDTILSSPALRAKSTAKMIARALGCMERIILERNIYEASWSDLLTVLKNIDNSYTTAILVGHNPGLSLLGHHLVGFDANLPTCGILEIDLDMDRWSDIDIAQTTLLAFEYPKKYQ